MNYNKIISALFISFLVINGQNVKAQALNIDGDTIFVNTAGEIQLIFPNLPTSFKTIPVNTNYRIWNSPTGINLIAKSEDAHPVILLVTEAQRIHHFILISKKKGNNEVKLLYDYSTEKKLAQHISETASKSIGLFRPEQKKNKKDMAAVNPVDSSSNYKSLLEQGDKELMLQNYEAAKLSFDKAHALRPNEITPLLRLEGLKIKLTEKEKSAHQEDDKKYLLLTEDAKNKIDQKKYIEASNIYNMALQLKPGDAYVTQQLEIVSNLLAGESNQSKKQKINAIDKEKIIKAQKAASDKQLTAENNYDTAVELADNFFNSGDYENAKREYNKALGFSNKDWPRTQINKINKIVSDQVAQANVDKRRLAQQQKIESAPIARIDSTPTAAEIKKKYNLALAMGRSSYLKNDLINAKTFYEEAMNLQPLQQLPKNQLKIINNKLEALARETELNDNYDLTIALADSQVIAKAYDSATANYKRALLLKPLESYPGKQLRFIQSELVQNEKRKKEEKEQQYNHALSRADKAVTEKRYDDAKSAYEEVLSIHADNEYARRRLEIISYQIEKARIDKLNQDAMKNPEPAKKSKRKKSSK